MLCYAVILTMYADFSSTPYTQFQFFFRLFVISIRFFFVFYWYASNGIVAVVAHRILWDPNKISMFLNLFAFSNKIEIWLTQTCTIQYSIFSSSKKTMKKKQQPAAASREYGMKHEKSHIYNIENPKRHWQYSKRPERRK